MRLTRIEFNGYKRLARTSCNVDGKLVAFVGPNEAGKSSVLEALMWLDSENEPLPHASRTRGHGSFDRPVVTATYRVSEPDREAMRGIGMAQTPTTFKISKYADGTVKTEASPVATWQVDPNTYVAAEPHALNACSNDDDDAQLGLHLQVERLASGTAHDVALHALHSDRPRFVKFGESDRSLPASFDFAGDARAPRALDGLLATAGTTPDRLATTVNNRNIATGQAAIEGHNQVLEQVIRASWSQSKLTVRLALDGKVVQSRIAELGPDGALTSIESRSDGLKMFIALLGFLHRTHRSRDAILLIDEAETHLHLDAQADLVEMLLGQQAAAQVLYTTHSPACLPPDLGTGIRLVVPSAKKIGTSELHNNFWTNESPGFSLLLFKMGAGAAAFSTCRHAVITEGPTEMILLPTLIRLATGLPHLLYQVAPGLSNARPDDPDLHLVAARPAFLVDGDKGGRTVKEQLIKAGVRQEHVLSLPDGQAVEDLLTTSSYLGAINAHLAECGLAERVTAADLDAGKTCGKAVNDWCKAGRISPPGKTVIASRLVNDPDQIELKRDAVEFLRNLHAQFMTILKLWGEAGSADTRTTTGS